MYAFGVFQMPVINLSEANATAGARCAACGYTSAEPFGGQKMNCLSQNGYGNCLRTQVTTTYQCLGTGTPPVAATASAAPAQRPSAPARENLFIALGPNLN